MTQSKIVIGGALLAVLALGGCSGGSVAGTPTPQTSTRPTSGAAAADGPGASLAQVEPCALLTNAEASTLGLPAGKPEKFGKKRECDFREIGSGLPVTGTVTIDPVSGIDQLSTPPDTDPASINKVTVDGRRVNYYLANGGTLCTVNVEVNKTETVHVQITLRQANTPEPACKIAEKAVGLVLPRMPKK